MIRFRSVIKSLLFCILLTICFIVLILLYSILVSSVGMDSASNVIEESFIKYLFSIGYGDIDTSSLTLRVILSFLGIVFLGLLYAYITFMFLVRKKLKLFNKIVIWKNGTEYIASFKLKNNGAEIIDVNITMQFYVDSKLIEVTNNHEIVKIPLISKNQNMIFDLPIKPGKFIYHAIRNFSRYKGKLFVIVKYNDNNTGQQFVNTFVFHKNDIVGSSHYGGYTKRKNSYKIKYNNNTKIDKVADGEMIINTNDATPISQATEIRYNCIDKNIAESIMTDYTCKIKDDIKIIITWNNRKQHDRFGMVLFKLPLQNWSYFYEDNWKIRFIVYEYKNIESFTVQVKRMQKNHLKTVLNERVRVKQLPQIVTISIYDCYKGDLLDSVCELCFTIFEDQIVDTDNEIELGITELLISEC